MAFLLFSNFIWTCKQIFSCRCSRSQCRHTQWAQKGTGDLFPPAGHIDGHAAAPGEEEPKAALLWKLKPTSDSRHGPSLSAAPHLCDDNVGLYWETLQLHMCNERGQVSSQLLVSIYTFTGNVDYLNDWLKIRRFVCVWGLRQLSELRTLDESLDIPWQSFSCVTCCSRNRWTDRAAVRDTGNHLIFEALLK